MGVPARFAIEYPRRALELIRLFEDIARGKDMIGSFGLLAAAAVLTIPYERMKAANPLHNAERDSDLAKALKELDKASFGKAPFWGKEAPGRWRRSRIMASVNNVDAWTNKKGQPSLSEEANSIEKKSADDIIRIIRNALAHGNIIYLDKDDREIAGNPMASIAFLSRCEDKEPPGGYTYNVVVTSDDEFLRFVKTWAIWVGSFVNDEWKVL